MSGIKDAKKKRARRRRKRQIQRILLIIAMVLILIGFMFSGSAFGTGCFICRSCNCRDGEFIYNSADGSSD